MSPTQKVLSSFVFTALGSSLTSLATFLSIESYFHGIKYLGIALCLRTLTSCIFGFNSAYIIQKLGLQNSFISSQAIAFFSIIILLLGFHYHWFAMVLIGLILIGLPLTFSTILLTITFKMSSSENHVFRKHSGSRELLFGFSRLAACILAPILLFTFNLNTILIIGIILFSIAGLFLFNVNFKNITQDRTSKPPIKIFTLMYHRDTWIYICQTTAAFLLAALIPILASSNNINFTEYLPPLLRQSLWSIEAVTMILASVIYLLARQVRHSETAKATLMLNGIFLVLFLFSTHIMMVMIVVTLISISMMLSFYIFRDDYVIKADDNTGLISAHAAFSAVQKDLIFSISPIILAYVLTNFGLSSIIIIVLSIQFILYLIIQFLQRGSVKPDVENLMN